MTWKFWEKMPFGKPSEEVSSPEARKLEGMLPKIFKGAKGAEVLRRTGELVERMRKDGVNLKDEAAVKRWLETKKAEIEAQAARAPKVEPFVHGGPQAGRNDPCPCGSGKKYKKCHEGKDLPKAPARR